MKYRSQYLHLLIIPNNDVHTSCNIQDIRQNYCTMKYRSFVMMSIMVSHRTNIPSITLTPAKQAKTPRPPPIFSQSDHPTQAVDTNSHSQWQTVQIQTSWLLQKPTNLANNADPELIQIYTICKCRAHLGPSGQGSIHEVVFKI